MRLFHVADYEGPYSGSFVPMLRAGIAAAAAEGWECHAVFSEQAEHRDWMPSFAATGVSCHFVASHPSRRAATALAALIGESRTPTIVHTHFSAFDVPAVRVARGQPETHVVWHNHSLLHRRPDAVLRNLVRFAVIGRGVDANLCVSPDVTSRVRRRLGHRVVFLPNAIDASRFELASTAARRLARARLGIPDGAGVLLHFGWEWERKGGPEYLRAARELLASGEQIIPLVVGGADDARRAAEQLGIAEAVRVLESTEDVRTLYAAADVFVAPARAEGMPFALTEALCSGTAAVASPLAGHRFIGGEIEACHICKSHPREIAREISALLVRERADVEGQSLAAHEWIAEHMGLDMWARRVMQIYRSAIGQRPGVTPSSL